MLTGTGIIRGFVLLVTAVILGGGIRAFLKLEAVMITLGGAIAATLISYPLQRLLKFFVLIVQLFRGERQNISEQTVSRIVELGQKASQDSIFALEKEAKDEKNRYLKAGLQLLVQDAPASRIARRFALEAEGVKSMRRESHFLTALKDQNVHAYFAGRSLDKLRNRTYRTCDWVIGWPAFCPCC